MVRYDLSITDVPIAVVDVETTGLYVEDGDRVTEVAVLRADPGHAPVLFSSLVNPGRPISATASKISGIFDEHVRAQPAFSSVAEEVYRLLDGAVVVAHQASFDVEFLSTEFAVARHALPISPVVDTLSLARTYFNFQYNSLQALARTFRVRRGTAHRAMGDCITTYEVFRRIADRLAELGYTTVRHLIEAQGRPIVFMLPQPTFLPPQLEEALRGEVDITVLYSEGHHPREHQIRPLWVSGDVLYAHDPKIGGQRKFELDRILDVWIVSAVDGAENGALWGV